MSREITCFKAYDVRGRVPDELNEDIAYRIARAYALQIQPEKVVVGHDIRMSSESICQSLVGGLLDSGVDVFHIGLCGTEEIYFSTFHYRMDGGIVVTASHNPMDYNGMKFVREQSRPISGDTGLLEIKEKAEQGNFVNAARKGKQRSLDHSASYIEHLLQYIDIDKLKPLKIVVNAGNGGAGNVIDQLAEHLPFEFVKLNHNPDGSFPSGVPNPLLEENRPVTIETIKESGADLGVAWDGDFDRCFFFDENGDFVEGYYIVGLLADAFLKKLGKGTVIHDPRLTWNTVDIVEKLGGRAVCSKTGHAFIKERMRSEDAVYGGEMSAHHYFRDFAYCDSGMIPWLLVTELISRQGASLAELVRERMARFPASGEINRRIPDPAAVLDSVKAAYEKDALEIDFIDGLSMDLDRWRFNLRTSNTEPVVRLNVESRGDIALMKERTAEILELMGGEAV
ncbi:MAG: phosphomannomutase [Pseudomonadales bacterium]|nr:phosphomannomutase [Pseudomonadales bacterium]MDP7359478.1 phosphomannomutase [Pseudomonadales bacterium]MDP7595402.1 phosphomannomutase [Pseudomonadales bacterium]HJN53171.1 phosphomannomutase [Pseudomonadales bacterium]